MPENDFNAQKQPLDILRPYIVLVSHGHTQDVPYSKEKYKMPPLNNRRQNVD